MIGPFADKSVSVAWRKLGDGRERFNTSNDVDLCCCYSDLPLANASGIDADAANAS
jgi:hypothetical protein